MKSPIRICLSSFFLLATTLSAQTVLYVDDDAAPGGDGLSWASPFADLQQALDMAGASNVSEIRVAGGVYKPSVRTQFTLPRSRTFSLVNGVAIRGGYRGLAPGGLSDDRDIVTFETILSGNLDVAGDDADNSYHVVTGIDLDATTVLDGLTIADANGIAGTPLDVPGGGMHNINGSPTLVSCTFRNNQAWSGGGMANADGSSPTLTACRFEGNTALTRGGGMFNEAASNPILTNCDFIENTVADLQGKGGGIHSVDGCAPRLTDCVFEDNAAAFGGGLSDDHGAPEVRTCTFTNNRATLGSSGGGGGFHGANSSALIIGCRFQNNAAYVGGGVLLESDSAPVIDDCTFLANAASRGGGMYLSISEPQVTNCMFASNTASLLGGGVFNFSGILNKPVFYNCQFIKNTAAASNGGAIYNSGTYELLAHNCTFTGNSSGRRGGGIAGAVVMGNCSFVFNTAAEHGGAIADGGLATNCIFWQNSAIPPYEQVGLADVTYSCVQGGWAGIGNITADPRFVDADGPDDVPGTQDDNLHLLPASPCINRGDTELPYGSPPFDYDGEPRVQQCRIDMGADETPYLGLDCNENGVADACDLEAGMSEDCNTNDFPDECEVAAGTAHDCNGNIVPDECDLAAGSSIDCNLNQIPDECDIAAGTATDYDGDGTPDTCRPVRNITQDVWYMTIREACLAAATGDIIWVTPGTYEENVLVVEPITLLGVAGAEETIIDGHGGICLRVYFDLGTDVLIEGFTFTNGSQGMLVGSRNYGTIRECVFRQNRAGGAGGGIEIQGGQPVLADCRFEENTATTYGGAMYNTGRVTAIRCAFIGNAATEGWGGAVSLQGDTHEFTDCQFVDNNAFFRGGAIHNTISADPNFTRCLFQHNDAGSYGGAIYNDVRCDPELTQCVFLDNTADRGGAIYNNNSYMRAVNCKFIGNFADQRGGGVYNWSQSRPHYIGCLFSGNRTNGDGAAVYNVQDSGPMQVVNCTITANTAGAAGGGITDRLNSTLDLVNTIVWNNTAPTGAQIHIEDTSTVVARNSCVQGGWPGTDIIDVDPLFEDADGQDDIPGTEDDYPALKLGSPCADAGAEDAAPAVLPETDLDGHARILCGTIDIGAYESGLGDYDCDDAVDIDDFAGWGPCMTGPGSQYDIDCAAFDVEFDRDIDLVDFEAFQKLLRK